MPRSRLSERHVALEIDLSKTLLSLCLRELALRLLYLSFGLVNGSLKWPRIYLKQDLSSTHRNAFAIFLLDNISAYLRLDLCVHKVIACRPNSRSEERRPNERAPHRRVLPAIIAHSMYAFCLTMLLRGQEPHLKPKSPLLRSKNGTCR